MKNRGKMRHHVVVLALLLFSCSLVKSQATGQTCTFDPAMELNSTAFYLEAKANRYRYPDATGQVSIGGDGDVAGLRIVCPGGHIISGNRPTNLSAAAVECVGGNTVKLAGSKFFYSPLNTFGCDKEAEPLVKLTGRKTADGKKIVEIGYTIGKTGVFLPVINDIAVNRFASGYIPRWAHFKALRVKALNPTSKGALKSSPLTPKLDFKTVYDLTEQRNSFATLFNDTALVDKYLPVDGTHSFVASQLVSQEDLYYENQRVAASYYETTVPVWSSVESGNWKLVGKAVRQIAAESLFDEVDVWSGTYLNLWLKNEKNKVTYVSLPQGLKPSQFLFKYVHDAGAKRGIVFITVNNPHLTEADEKNVICEEIPACRDQYPQFNDFTKGYTYCCSLEGFAEQAKKLGLPQFKDSIELAF